VLKLSKVLNEASLPSFVDSAWVQEGFVAKLSVVLPEGESVVGWGFNFEGLDRVHWTMMLVIPQDKKWLYYLTDADIFEFDITKPKVVLTNKHMAKFREIAEAKLKVIIEKELAKVDATV